MRAPPAALVSLVLLVSALGGACAGASSPPPAASTSSSVATSTPAPDPTAAIDRALEAAWTGESITPAPAADDATWLRRASVDLLGRVPTEDEVRAYMAETTADKKARAADRMLADPEHALRLARWWEDVLLGPEVRDRSVDRGALRRWLTARFARNDGWDTITSGLITAAGTSSAGGTRFDRFVAADEARAVAEAERAVDGAVNWQLRYRKSPPDLAGAASRTFLGVQIQCAQCHDHRTERWTQADFASFAASFANVRIRPVDRRDGVFALDEGERPAPRLLRDALAAPMALAPPRALDGTDLGRDEGSRREQLAAWMVSPENPWTRRAFVNRVWARYLGMGFVDPVDDFRAGSPPVLAPLLDDLAARFAASGWDVRALERAIVLSRAYGGAAAPMKGDVQTARWSAFAARPMDEDALVASLLLVADAERRLTGMPDRASAALRERVRRSIAVAFDEDAESNPTRADVTIQQVLLLMNADLVARGTSSGPRSVLATLDAREAGDLDRIVSALHLRVLGRPPTAAEMERARQYVAASPSRDQALEDLFWALLNTAELSTVH